MAKNKINLGCGQDIKEGYINVDKIQKAGVDVVFDLNVIPYPYDDNTFDEIILLATLEHLDNPLTVMEEIWRIAKPKAKVKVTVPFYNSGCAWGDITHKHSFNYESFTHLTRWKNVPSDDPQTGTMYTEKYFIIKNIIGKPTGLGKMIPNIKIKAKGRTGLRDCLAHLCGDIISELHFELEADKNG